MDIQELRDEILLATLPNVPFDGWSQRALRFGLDGLGLEPAVARRAFPGGAADLVAHFSDWADREMLTAVTAQGEAFTGARLHERVIGAVRMRLELLEPHKDAVRRALALLALPQHAGLSLRLLQRTVDAVWTAAGDPSTDFSYYTKRVLLAAVYSATVLYWLSDRSEDHQGTWDFLERRVSTVMRAGSLARDAGRLGSLSEAPLRAAAALRERLAARRRPA